jgi:hypothetical protein
VRAFDATGRLAGLRELNGAEGCGGQACPTAHFGLPVQAYHISVCLSDGRAAQKQVIVPRNGAVVTFGEGHFD